MPRRSLLILCVLMTSFFSKVLSLPKIIDFGKFLPVDDPRRTHDQFHSDLGYYAFNVAPEFIPFFAYLKQEFQIDAAVETGTNLGSTTLVFSRLFDEVHTIEIVESLYENTRKRLSNISNLTCHLGSSEKILNKILPNLQEKRILFYLDAHWESYWPLLDELEAIKKTHHNNCIVVIDDIKVPGREDILYDAYNSDECSYEYIKDKLDKIYSEYTVHYIIPKSNSSKAKLVAIPKNWK